MIYFEDLYQGQPLSCKSFTIHREEIIDFAQKFDPQRFHLDENFAKQGIFKGLVASSLHVLSACTKQVVDAQGQMAILSGVGMDEVTMFTPVRPGDTLNVKAAWQDLKRSQSKPDRGFARIKCEVFNQKKEKVIVYGYQYLVACRTHGK
ncbi:MAG: acyl dehydratase [Desulfobacteraceae bacterium]|nr:acyl dehydratase [Desulfobacteraceae bacterium]